VQVGPFIVSLLLGIVGGIVLLLGSFYFSRRSLREARGAARQLLAEARQYAENRKKELLVTAQERILGVQEEADQRERELDERESKLDVRIRKLDRESSQMGTERKRLERTVAEADRLKRAAEEADAGAQARLRESQQTLEGIAGLSQEQARAELIAKIEQEARSEALRLSRKIEDEARESAERQAVNLMIQASQRVNIQDVVESTVSFIELPSDEMKGRIIGREGRNIRALEMVTGIDLRREIAHVAIDRLVEDGRIHPGRIEEVVQKVREEFDELVMEKGNEAAYSLGISDLHTRLVRAVGEMRYHTCHGQNLLQHCLETALIAGHMARDVGARVEVTQRAGLLHEIGQIEKNSSSHTIFASAEFCAKHGEADEVVHAVRSLHPDVEAKTVEAMLLQCASRMSDHRPGARKENLAVFIERLTRLENIAMDFDGVRRAFAVKAGKELRVIIDAGNVSDQKTYGLCKKIARALERDLSYPGQIKVSAIRETRAVRFAV
jgi:ribonuclease Y